MSRVFPSRSPAGFRLVLATTAALCLSLASLALAPGSALGSAAARRPARAARTESIAESAHLHLTSKQGFTLNEQGTTAGTIAGPIYIHLHVANNHGDVSAEVNIYPRGGSLSGQGTASYTVDGPLADFSGRLSITRGTGRYAGAHASSLHFSGSIQRRDNAVTVTLSGSLSV
jgi:hypothetical protein